MTLKAPLSRAGDATELHAEMDMFAERAFPNHGNFAPPRYTRRPLFRRPRPLVAKANPALDASSRAALVERLMAARRALRRDAPPEGRAHARAEVDVAKTGLGERGPVW